MCKSILNTFATTVCVIAVAHAQTPPNPLEGLGKGVNDSTLQAVLLQDIKAQHNSVNDSITKKVTELDKRLVAIDSKLEKERDAQKRVEGLVERVQLLEKKDVTVHANMVSVYEHNYKSAVVNLVFMERELKPLVLFNASREFFESLTDVSNPMNYKGYNDWFGKFKSYMDKNKATDATLAVVDNLLKMSGDISKGIPLGGPLANTLLSSIGTFINSMSKKEKELREESMKMFELTAMLSQFTHERNLVETEWDKINKELDELQRLHQECLQQNFAILGIERKDFDQNFANEMDANKRFDYIKNITTMIADRVRVEKEKNPDKWKTTFYFQMQTVQSLKVRFGTLTFRMRENINKYQALITRYQNVSIGDIKDNMVKLGSKLDKLNSAFDATFNPQSYIQAANRMYIVD